MTKKPIVYKETLKFNLWTRYFLGMEGDEETKKKTFGNATQSAILAYNLDPQSQYQIAGVMGNENLKKLKFLRASLLERKGITFEKLMEVGVKKMMEGDYSDWERFMERLGYFDDRDNVGVAIQINNVLSGKAKEYEFDKV